MPVTPQISWSETEESLSLSVAIPGFALRKATLTVSDVYLGVNHTPHLLALDLYAEVKPDETVVKAGPGGLQLQLTKVGRVDASPPYTVPRFFYAQPLHRSG
jgi:dyslexia susceptibility 1 candidate gene 1 protein